MSCLMEGDFAVSDDEMLIRLTFCTEHHDGENFLVTAISLDDLKDRGFSVDREIVSPRSALLSRIEVQQERKPEQRVRAIFSRLSCGAVRREIDENGAAMFEVRADPMDGNDGHALILSAQNVGKGKLRQFRVKLLEHLNNVVDFDSLKLSES